MEAPGYTYDERLWKPSFTKLDHNNFFHAAFGTKNSETEEYSDRFVHIRRKNWENYLSYIQNEDAADIAERTVTVEDIPILAALENVKIVILSELEPNSPNIITPDEEILQDYPYKPSKCNGEVILFLQDKFSRMEELSPSKLNENNVENQEEEDQENNVGNEPNGYNKGESAGLKGIQYQIGLLIIFLLNAFRNLEKWKLSTENKDAGKFDDVVLEWPKGSILLQSKFKKDKKITLDDLLSDNPKNDDFSLPKYFLFHQKAKAKFKSKHLLIICTNASVHKNTEEYLTLQDVCPKSMLHYESSTSKFYTFNEKILDLLKQNSKSYYDKNCKNKEIEESVITEKNLKDFLKRLQFYCNYPPQKGTEEIIENLLSLNKLQRKMSTQEIISKVTDWYQQKKGVYMSYIHAIAKFHEISRDRYYQILEQYNVFFQNKDLDWNKSTMQIFHIITETGYLLHELKIYRDLQNNKNKILYLSPNESIDVQKEVLDVFGQLPYIFLVIIWPSCTDDKVINEICSELKNIFKEGRKYKKIFLVAVGNILSRQRELVIDDNATITEYVTFEKLSNDTKKRLLNQEVIIFQGKKVNLNQLFSPKTVEDCPGAVNLETLQKLVKKEEIKVGIPLSNLDHHTNKCYIGRMFKREHKMGNSELKDIKKTIYFSYDIYDPEEKIILIKGSSGMGKTIELAKLAVDLKEKYNHLWVIKLELKDYAGILKRYAAEKKTIDIKKLLSFKCTNHLDECVFSVDQKVVMLLDGIDDVSHYMTLITDFLIQCKNSPNFAKIFATTKPHVTPELEKKLEIKPFVLQPFTRQNQVEFLRRYFTCNSELDKDTCEHYANTILMMLSWENSINNNAKDFAAIPFQAKIAADHFQELIVS